MMEANTAPTEKYAIKRVFSRTISNISKDWQTFALYAVVASVIFSAVATYVFSVTTGLLPAGNSAAGFAHSVIVKYWTYMGISMLLAFVFNGFILSGMMAEILKSQAGEAINFTTLLKSSFHYLFKYLSVAVVAYIGLILGFVLLIIPGFILALMWSVAIPYLIDHDSGVWAALQASRELTKGMRWKILASTVLFVLAQIIVMFLLQGFSLKGFMHLYRESPALAAISQLAFYTINYLLGVSFFTSIYQEAKLVKAASPSPAAVEPAPALS